jgi:hypothetical protein
MRCKPEAHFYKKGNLFVNFYKLTKSTSCCILLEKLALAQYFLLFQAFWAIIAGAIDD